MASPSLFHPHLVHQQTWKSTLNNASQICPLFFLLSHYGVVAPLSFAWTRAVTFSLLLPLPSTVCSPHSSQGAPVNPSPVTSLLCSNPPWLPPHSKQKPKFSPQPPRPFTTCPVSSLPSPLPFSHLNHSTPATVFSLCCSHKYVRQAHSCLRAFALAISSA